MDLELECRIEAAVRLAVMKCDSFAAQSLPDGFMHLSVCDFPASQQMIGWTPSLEYPSLHLLEALVGLAYLTCLTVAFESSTFN